ncbi:hypothetical protein ACSBR1_019159 [Camellia fascicularis]
MDPARARMGQAGPKLHPYIQPKGSQLGPTAAAHYITLDAPLGPLGKVQHITLHLMHLLDLLDLYLIMPPQAERGKTNTKLGSEKRKSGSGQRLGEDICLIECMLQLQLIAVRIEFSGHGEMNPTELEEEIEKKREEFHSTFQPFYRRCKKNEVKLEVILAAGYDPCEKTIEQAQNYNTQWIVLDSHLKKHKAHIHGRVTCNIAVFKGKDVATLISSRTPEYKTDGKSVANVGVIAKEDDELQHEVLNPPPEKSFIPAPTTPPSPCWYPLSWRTGFPRAFSISELGEITNGFADSNIVVEEHEKKVYKGIYQETRVLIKLFSASDDQFWSLLKILSRVRHRNILNLVGYCCTDASLYLLCDYPCNGTVETNLLCDESAKRLSWRVRWYIALEIGIGLRYLHEECVDGPIADLSVCSTYVVFSSGSTVMLSIFNTAKWLKDDLSHNEDPPAESLNAEEDKHLSADIHDYGLFLIELITGKSAQYFQKQAKGQSLIDWALPFLENGFLNQVMDPRVTDTSDTGVVSHMSRAALLCLKNDTAHKFSISEV